MDVKPEGKKRKKKNLAPPDDSHGCQQSELVLSRGFFFRRNPQHAYVQAKTDASQQSGTPRLSPICDLLIRPSRQSLAVDLIVKPQLLALY